MTGKLCLLCCGNFHKEIATAVNAEGWDDVEVTAFPAGCGRPPVDWEESSRLLPDDCTHTAVLGSACTWNLNEAPPVFPAMQVTRVAQCFHLITAGQLVDDAISNGSYLLTPGWLADWRVKLRAMGYEPEQADNFFQDFARELLLLDTGVNPHTPAHLGEFQTYVRLPVRRIGIGLDHTRLLLARIVLQWRFDRCRETIRAQHRGQSRERADNAAAMDMLVQLAKTQQESEAITVIRELFTMLFAPSALHYLRVENKVTIADTPIPDGILQLMQGMDSEYSWTPGGNGFLLRIERDGDVLGLIAVDGLAFPQYRDRYLNMALSIAGICGLAIENARNRSRLIESEKMASLSTVVAGVAHEVGTPLGVCLTAASMLQDESGKIATQLAEHTMTRAGLSTHLARAREAATLLTGNLERIGRLVDAFRQVSVGDVPQKKQLFRLRDCIDEVISSMNSRFEEKRVSVQVACDPSLQLESLYSDWADIFRNLFDNSLKHGFRNSEQGAIILRVSSPDHTLQVEYRDDGAGLAPEVQARIFDPFFTTDLQHGTGLGMHLVYNLITHRMNGTIQCTSEPGHGLIYLIEVPR
jgi:signal transduction histidine kinase